MPFDSRASAFSIDDADLIEDSTRQDIVFGAIAGNANAAVGSAREYRGWLNATPNGVLARAFDFVFALSILIAAAPFMLILIVIMQIDSPGPVLFVQRRIGRGGLSFPCFKLRTMVVDAADKLEVLLRESPTARAEWETDHKLRADPRVTRLGRLVRLFSLDEIPQLLNIVLGHMSVVGPRPIVDAEIWRYGSSFTDYCSIRPGLTGLWQVSGRNNTTYDERVRLDRHYARNWSFALNIKIIARTFTAVLAARGAH